MAWFLLNPFQIWWQKSATSHLPPPGCAVFCVLCSHHEHPHPTPGLLHGTRSIPSVQRPDMQPAASGGAEMDAAMAERADDNTSGAARRPRRRLQPPDGCQGPHGEIRFMSARGRVWADCKEFSFKGATWYGSEDWTQIIQGLEINPMSFYFEFLSANDFNAARLLFAHESVGRRCSSRALMYILLYTTIYYSMHHRRCSSCPPPRTRL